MTGSIRSAVALLHPTEIVILHVGECAYELADRVRAIPAEQIFASLTR